MCCHADNSFCSKIVRHLSFFHVVNVSLTGWRQIEKFSISVAFFQSRSPFYNMRADDIII